MNRDEQEAARHDDRRQRLENILTAQRETFGDLYALHGIVKAEDMSRAQMYASEQSAPDADEVITDPTKIRGE